MTLIKRKELDLFDFSKLVTFRSVENYRLNKINKIDKYIHYVLSNNGLVGIAKPTIHVNMICHIINLYTYFVSGNIIRSKLREIQTTGVCIYSMDNILFTVNAVGNKNDDISSDYVLNDKYNHVIITLDNFIYKINCDVYPIDNGDDLRLVGQFRFGCIYVNII